MNKLICVAYIAAATGMMMGSVGQIPIGSTRPVTWQLSLWTFIALAIPAVFGYMAGKDDYNK